MSVPLLDVLLPPSTRANQPLPAAAPIGAIYCVTDEGNILEQNTGVAWLAYGPAGGGDVTGPGVSVDGELALFNGVTGALLKRATGTGVAHVASGVFSVAAVDLAA